MRAKQLEMETVLQQMDLNGDGVVDLEDFIAWAVRERWPPRHSDLASVAGTAHQGC
jgi:hypothetical protein